MMIEMIDTKLYVMPDSFTKLQQECMSSTSNYFAQLLNDFIILYCVFIAILIVSMIYASVFAFKRLRRSMWNTNMLLKIIPPQTLSKKDEEKLK